LKKIALSLSGFSFAFTGSFFSQAISFITGNESVAEIRETAETVAPPPPVASLSSSESFLLSQQTTNQIKEEDIKEIPLLTTFGGTALMNPQMVETKIKPEIRKEIVTYVVESGDTASSIAAEFDLKTSTILWNNGLTEDSILSIGDELSILPIDGIAHKVKEGDTLSGIVEKWSGDLESTKVFNVLSEDDQLSIGEYIIVPDGIKPAPPPPAPAPSTTSSGSGSAYTGSGSVVGYQGQGSYSDYNRFPWGWCTWYVASRRNVPWSGNANMWMENAAAMGYATGYTPVAGAIVETSESWWGHVALVESVNGDGTITVSEMNYVGFGVASSRRIPINSSIIVGYIY